MIVKNGGGGALGINVEGIVLGSVINVVGSRFSMKKSTVNRQQQSRMHPPYL